jgi:hypothetical protein
MLAAYKLPQFLWELAVAHATYLQNMSYTKVLPHATPYQVWHGRKPNVSHLREFGVPIWVLLQGQHVQNKMLPKSQCHIYVGYDDRSHSVKYYNPEMRSILLSRNYRYLNPVDPAPSHDVLIDLENLSLDPSNEGEQESQSIRTSETTMASKCKAPEVNINPRETCRFRDAPDWLPDEPRKMWGI